MARHKGFVPDDVIDKSIDVFLAKGYEATSVKDIVETTNVHPGSLYNAFGSKKEIFKKALERFVQVSRFNVTLAEAETAPPRATIERLFHDLIDSTGQRGAVGKCLVTNAVMELGGVDDEVTAWLEALFQTSEKLLCRLIERGQAAGEIASPRPARELARFLAGTVQGMQMMSRLGSAREELRAVSRIALSVLDQAE